MNNKYIFVDSSGFLALANKEPDVFLKVSSVFEDAYSAGRKIITTDYVMDEVFTWMRCKQKIPIQDVLKFGLSFKTSDVQIFGITDKIFYDAFSMMVKYKDHYFSFTDCVSFTVMKSQKITDVITRDKHFTVAGFTNLLS